jgi:hypothetical protein
VVEPSGWKHGRNSLEILLSILAVGVLRYFVAEGLHGNLQV